MQVLNKYDKEILVIKLHQEGKTIREIASAAHLSFGDIDRVIKKLDGSGNDENDINLSNKSKLTQAIYLFKCGKKPIDVAIELDISAGEIENILQEYWVLTNLDELACIYPEIKNHLDQFLNLFHIIKKNKLVNQKDIKMILGYAADLPSLESKFRSLANTVLDLEIKKKELNYQLMDLRHIMKQCQNTVAINNK
jgi:hypothetical protein